MMQTEFEELVREHEDDLQQIRSKYFPLIERGIITGYNLYPALFDCSKGKFFLNYLHSDLKSENRHFRELTNILRREGFLEEMILINNELVDRESTMGREADYITRPDWEDPPNMRYFTFRGRELSQEEAKTLRRMVIGESFQFDLMFRIKDEIELRGIVDLFKKYTSKNILDKFGNEVLREGFPVENTNAIYNAWEVPLLTCTSNDNKKPRNLRDFLTIYQFRIEEKLGGTSVILSTLVRKNSKLLIRIMNEKGEKVRVDKKYALRVFVEGYIDK